MSTADAKYQLQVNERGAWRRVCEFEEPALEDVSAAVSLLARSTSVKWCLVAPTGRRTWFDRRGITAAAR